jgi:hypothetical protein
MNYLNFEFFLKKYKRTFKISFIRTFEQLIPRILLDFFYMYYDIGHFFFFFRLSACPPLDHAIEEERYGVNGYDEAFEN